MDTLTTIITDGLRIALGSTGAYFALAALGLNVHYGYTGLLNFGQVGFMLMGGYGLAVSISVFALPVPVAILIGLGLSVLLALALGVPTLRLRADYLAITTIAAAEILRFVANSQSMLNVTGGPFGLPSAQAIDPVTGQNRPFADWFYNMNPIPDGNYFWDLNFTERKLWSTVVGWVLVALAAWLISLLVRSPWGRVLKSIREDEDAARSLGKNVFSFKMQSLVLGGAIGGVAGMLLVLDQSAVTALAFQPQTTFFAYTIMILGGAATVRGPIIGSIIFWFLATASDTLLRTTGLASGSSVGAIRLMLVGLGLMALMAFRPQGIFGDKQEMMLDV